MYNYVYNMQYLYFFYVILCTLLFFYNTFFFVQVNQVGISTTWQQREIELFHFIFVVVRRKRYYLNSFTFLYNVFIFFSFFLFFFLIYLFMLFFFINFIMFLTVTSRYVRLLKSGHFFLLFFFFFFLFALYTCRYLFFVTHRVTFKRVPPIVCK